MKHTNKEITTFINAATDWQNTEKRKQKNGESHDLDTKFNYAVRKVLAKATRAYEKYVEDVEDVNIEYAAQDEHKIVLRDAQGYLYTKEELKKRVKALRELQYQEADVETHFAPEFPSSVTDAQRDAMLDFVVKNEAEPDTHV